MTVPQLPVSHDRQPDRLGSMGTTIARCSCGWESTGTNRPQHLGRTFRSHAQAWATSKATGPQLAALKLFSGGYPGVQLQRAGRTTYDACVRKGWLTFDGMNYAITDAGRAIVAPDGRRAS